MRVDAVIIHRSFRDSNLPLQDKNSTAFNWKQAFTSKASLGLKWGWWSQYHYQQAYRPTEQETWWIWSSGPKQIHAGWGSLQTAEGQGISFDPIQLPQVSARGVASSVGCRAEQPRGKPFFWGSMSHQNYNSAHIYFPFPNSLVSSLVTFPILVMNK